MDYKKIFKSAKTRRIILNILSFVPDSIMLKIQYRIKTGRKLNLKNPERFTEKLQWYKLHYRNELMKKCVDKYNVREYIKSCGLDDILNGCFGVYDSVSDIDFDALPNKFVIKKTNGSGGLNVLICRNKQDFDIEYAKKIMADWLADKQSDTGGREWAYSGLKPRIVIEEYLENEINPEAGISDYKFFCANGKAVGLVVDVERYIEHKRNFYDIEWNFLDVSSDCPNVGDCIPKPEGFEKLVEVANILCKGFPFVRVDLYLVNKKVYFGEMTFYPWSGYVEFTPDSYDLELGNFINLKEDEK